MLGARGVVSARTRAGEREKGKTEGLGWGCWHTYCRTSRTGEDSSLVVREEFQVPKAVFKRRVTKLVTLLQVLCAARSSSSLLVSTVLVHQNKLADTYSVGKMFCRR